MDLHAFPFHLARVCRVMYDTWKREFSGRALAFDPAPNVENAFRSEYIANWFSLMLGANQKNIPENLEVVRTFFSAIKPTPC